MSKTLLAAVLAAGLLAAPLPLLTPTAAAQTTQPTAPEKKQAKTKKPPTPGSSPRASG